MKTRTIEEIEDEIKSLSRKRDVAMLDANKHQEKLLTLLEELYELRPNYVKVDCFRCGAVGYLQGDDGKKHICDLCAGKEFTWMKLYEKDKK